MHCEYCNKNVKNFVTHSKTKLHQQNLIKGAGLVDDVIGYGKKILNKGLDVVKGLTEKLLKYGFNNVSKDTITKYGGLKIKSVILMRKPIDKYVNVMANLISQNALDKIKKNYGYDQFYHVAMGIYLANPSAPNGYTLVVYERVENVMIRPSAPKLWTDYQKYTFAVTKDITLDEMINKTIDAIGQKTYFSYNPITLNCQVFLKNTIEYGLNMWNNKISQFLYQPIDPNDFPELAGKAMSILTDLGKIGSQVIGGQLQRAKPRVRIQDQAKADADFFTRQKKLSEKYKQEQYKENDRKKIQEQNDKLSNYIGYIIRMHLGKTTNDMLKSIIQFVNQKFPLATNKTGEIEKITSFVKQFLNEKHIPEPETQEEEDEVLKQIELYDNRTAGYIDGYINKLAQEQMGAVTKPQIDGIIRLINDLFDDDLQEHYFQKLQDLINELAQRTEKLPSWLSAITDISKFGLKALGYGNVVDKVERAQDVATGFLGSGLTLHAIKINKKMNVEDAKKHAKAIAKKNNLLYSGKMKNYHSFRYLPKTKFIPKSYRTKKVNDNLMLVFGKLKNNMKQPKGSGLTDIWNNVKDWFGKAKEKVVETAKRGVEIAKDPVGEIILKPFVKASVEGLKNAGNTKQKRLQEWQRNYA